MIFMITSIIIASLITCIFFWLAVRQRQPIIKSYARLNKGYAPQLSLGVFVLQDEKLRLVFVKDLLLGVMVDGRLATVYLNSKITRYSVGQNCMSIFTNNYNLNITKCGIRVETDKPCVFSFTYTRPDFMYSVNKRRGRFVLGGSTPFMIDCDGFTDINVVAKKGEFIFSATVERTGRFNFSKQLNTISKAELSLLKKQLFGIYSTKNWAIIPNFSRTSMNALQKSYLKSILDVSQRTIALPKHNLHIVALTREFWVQNYAHIDLDKVGFSKLVDIKMRGKTVIIKDMLAGFAYKINSRQYFECYLENFFGRTFLCIEPNAKEAFFCVTPLWQYLTATDLDYPLLNVNIGEIEPKSMDFTCVLDRINALILHGYYVDVPKILRDFNLHYFSPYFKFLVANIVLSFITVFSKKSLLKEENYSNLLISAMDFAIKNINSRTYCFLKKFLPLVEDKGLYNKIFTLIIDSKDKLRPNCYEFSLTEDIGWRICGSRLFLKPSKDIRIDASLHIRDKTINITSLPNWSKVRIEKLNLLNVDSFEIDRLDKSTLLIYE